MLGTPRSTADPKTWTNVGKVLRSSSMVSDVASGQSTMLDQSLNLASDWPESPPHPTPAISLAVEVRWQRSMLSATLFGALWAACGNSHSSRDRSLGTRSACRLGRATHCNPKRGTALAFEKRGVPSQAGISVQFVGRQDASSECQRDCSGFWT